jgi:hypothetical protein
MVHPALPTAYCCAEAFGGGPIVSNLAFCSSPSEA